MLSTIGHLTGCAITAADGRFGHVKDAYFDDETWTIRYLVVDTESWLSGREVLISPYSVKQPLGTVRNIDVALTREQIAQSTPIDTHRPVTRRHEQELSRHYAFPQHWSATALWAMEALPLPLPNAVESKAEVAVREQGVPPEDVSLRSSAIVTGYDLQATDDSIGHVGDFVFDDESWVIRYLVVDTRNRWRGGKQVLLATQWIDDIDWADRTVFAKLTRAQVESSPAYESAAPITPEYEKRLHDAYDRTGYWA